jgi:hypothetical protein
MRVLLAKVAQRVLPKDSPPRKTSRHLPTHTQEPMKKYILAAALASLCAACDKAPETPPAETKETTIVNPPAKETTVVAPKEEKKEVVKEKEVVAPAPAPTALSPAPEVKEEKKETTTTTETKPEPAPAAPAPAPEPPK